MARPVACRVVDMPDGRFAVMAVLASGKVFRRVGLGTLADAEANAEVLRALMAACGVPVDLQVSARGSALPGTTTSLPAGTGGR